MASIPPPPVADRVSYKRAVAGSVRRRVAGILDSLPPPIEDFAAVPLIGDGVADDSAAFIAAHDAAYAAGVREVLVSRVHNIPTARDIGQVIYRGQGRLITADNAFARVIPFAVTSDVVFLGHDLVPSVHLAKFRAAPNPVVLVVGDSRFTSAANFVSPISNSWGILQDVLRRQNPGKTITFVSRAISGQGWPGFASASTTDPNPTGHPDWTWTAGQSWLQQAVNVQADLVVIGFGMNANTAPNEVDTALTALCGGAKVPDIVFLTSGGANTATSGGQKQRLANAGFVRSIAHSRSANQSIPNMPPAGLVDYGRLWWRARYGIDPARQTLRRVITNPVVVPQSTPYELPLSWGDLDITFTMAASNSSPDITLTTDAGFNSGGWSLVRIDRSITNLRGAAILNNGGANQFSAGGALVTQPPTGTYTFRITLIGSWLRITFNDGTTQSVLFNAPITRYPDMPTRMTLNTGFTGGLTITQCAVGEPEVCMQTFTEAEMWGTDPNGPSAAAPFGGNAVNHETSLAMSRLMRPVFEMSDWR